jgi:type IV pilus secretin PilQ/predicted competence protein
MARTLFVREVDSARRTRDVLAVPAIAVALTALTALAAVAQDTAQPAPALFPFELADRAAEARSFRASSARSVTLDVRERNLADVISEIRERAEVNIVLAPGVDEKVTLRLVDVPWKKALELAAEQAGCVVIEDGPNLLRVEKPPRVTFYFENTDVKKVVDAIAKVSGANIIVAPEVQGSVSMRFNDVPWRKALDSIVKTLGFTVVEESANILRVVSPSKLEENLESRIYELKYLRPPAGYIANIDTDYAINLQKQILQRQATGGGSGGGQQGGGQGQAGDNFSLLKALKKVLSAKGVLDYIQEKNILIVTDTKPKLDEIGAILSRIDVEPAQIFVDVKFVVTGNTDFFDLGIDIGDQGLQVSTNGGSIPSRLPFTLGDGGFEDEIIASESEEGPFGFPDSEVTGGGSQVVFGTLDFTKASMTLRILKRDVSTQIIQAPKLLALDNHEATIFVGETVRFAQVEAEQGQAGGLRVGIEEAENSPVQTGLQLFVIPHIIPGTNKIVMTVIPKEDSLSGKSAEQPGFDVFKFGSGSEQQQITLPRVSSRTLVTNMMLESGQTAVIGGLIFESDSQTVNKIPLLGDIPILGYFFKNEVTNVIRNNLIIFLTPTIIRDSRGTMDLLKGDLQDNNDSLRRRFPELFHKGNLHDDDDDPKEPAPEEETPPPMPSGEDLGGVRDVTESREKP